MEIRFEDKESALNFLEECKKKRLFILGIERFDVINNNLIPDLNGIADFSDLDEQESEKSIDLSRDFLSEYGSAKSEAFFFTIKN